MSLFDGLTGSRPANPDVVPISASELRQALLKLNRDDLAWRVEGSDDSPVDLVAMWKFDDPRWSSRLNEASMLPEFHTRLGVTPGLRVRLRLHEDVHVVRSLDEDFEFGADAGLKGFSLQGNYGAGQLAGSSIQLTYGRREDGTFGRLSSARFSTEDIKGSLRQVVVQNGWTWRGMMIGGL